MGLQLYSSIFEVRRTRLVPGVDTVVKTLHEATEYTFGMDSFGVAELLKRDILQALGFSDGAPDETSSE